MASECPPPDNDKVGTNNHHATSNAVPPTTNASKVSKPGATESKKTTKLKRPHDCFEWAGLLINFGLFFATSVAAIGAVIAAYVFWGQLVAMRGQLYEMQAEQRPWIYILDLFLYGNFEFTPSSGASVHIAFKLENSGHTPGRHVHLRMRMFNLQNGWPISIEREQQTACESHNAKGTWDTAEVTVFPGKPQEIDSVVVMDQSYIDIAANGKSPPNKEAIVLRNILSPVIVGCVEYELSIPDGKPHMTPFTYFLVLRDPTHQEPLTRESIPFSSDTREIPSSGLRLDEDATTGVQTQ